MIRMTAEDKISRAIIKLQKPQPFFAYLMMNMVPKKMPEWCPMQTMGVDAKGNLYYAPDFINKISEEQLLGTLCHEVLHVAFLHMTRTGDKNKELANISQDVLVNMMVTESHLELPEDTIPYDSYDDSSTLTLNGAKLKVADVSKKTWEQVYYELHGKLKKKNKQMPQDGKNDKRSCGFDAHLREGIGDGQEESLSPQEVRELEQKWSQAIAEAARYAKQQGNVPKGMERYIDELFKPKVQWKAILLKYLKAHLNPVDWSYQRPHRKSQVLEVYLPSTLKESCEIEVLVDTSGSIGQKELTEFLSEIVAIAQSMQHIQMTISFIDTEIHTRYEVDNGDIPKILSMKPTGGGGTDMEHGLDQIKEKNPRTPVTVVLTDGWTSFHKRKKDYPFDVIWVVSPNGITADDMRRIIPYGERVKMED